MRLPWLSLHSGTPIHTCYIESTGRSHMACIHHRLLHYVCRPKNNNERGLSTSTLVLPSPVVSLSRHINIYISIPHTNNNTVDITIYEVGRRCRDASRCAFVRRLNRIHYRGYQGAPFRSILLVHFPQHSPRITPVA